MNTYRVTTAYNKTVDVPGDRSVVDGVTLNILNDEEVVASFRGYTSFYRVNEG